MHANGAATRHAAPSSTTCVRPPESSPRKYRNAAIRDMVLNVRRLMSLVLGLIAVAAIAVAAAGCGNAEKNDYVDQVNEIQNNLQTQAAAEINSAPTSPAQAGKFAER